MRKVPVAPDVKAEIIARGTPGFSGADLANLVNEAALFAARKNKRLVDMDDFERAKDKIVMGAGGPRWSFPKERAGTTPFTRPATRGGPSSFPKTVRGTRAPSIRRGRARASPCQL